VSADALTGTHSMAAAAVSTSELRKLAIRLIGPPRIRCLVVPRAAYNVNLRSEAVLSANDMGKRRAALGRAPVGAHDMQWGTDLRR